MGDQGKVVGFLDRASGQHRPARRPGMHHVAVVAEDRQRVGCESSSRDVDDRGGQLAGDLEHVRDHEQEALGRREGRGQCALLKCAVHRARGAALGLHFDHVRDLAPQVRLARSRPVVGMLGHRRGRRDREDRDDLAHLVSDPGGRFVAVETLPPLIHSSNLPGSCLPHGGEAARRNTNSNAARSQAWLEGNAWSCAHGALLFDHIRPCRHRGRPFGPSDRYQRARDGRADRCHWPETERIPTIDDRRQAGPLRPATGVGRPRGGGLVHPGGTP